MKKTFAKDKHKKMAETIREKVTARNVASGIKLSWEQRGRDEWYSQTPDGELSPARVRRSKNADNTVSMSCFRNATALAILRDKDTPDLLKRAQAVCQKGEKAGGADGVLRYVADSPGDVPLWLRLTEEERRAVRATYAYAAPSESRVRMHVAAGKRRGVDTAADPSDPGTRKLLEEMGREEGGPMNQKKMGTRAGKNMAGRNPNAVLAPVAGVENPAKPGTKRHARYAKILDGAAAGMTVAALLADGANDVTLGKCISKGMVELRQGGK